MGGRIGLKGTDGAEILAKARALGAEPQAEQRAAEAVRGLEVLKGRIEIITCRGAMGEGVAVRCGFSPSISWIPAGQDTTAGDTRGAAEKMRAAVVDLLLFAGGDGTARDICGAVGTSVVVLGIPAGVKIHSAVFARNPARAGELAALYLEGKAKGTAESEVMDINEEDYRRGILSAKLHGYLRIPRERRHMQSLKAGSAESERHAQEAIASEIVENLSDDYYYVIGPGTTTRAIMERLNLDHSLLGVDIVHRKRLIGKDLNEKEILEKTKGRRTRIVVTPIGGQGYILGRGNQQLSPRVIEQAGTENILVAATRQKINSLRGRPLLVDTGDGETDRMFGGYQKIITGYREMIIYRIEH